MIAKTAAVWLLLSLLALPAAPALAQDFGAEVRTWSGRSLTLRQASFEVVYTVVPQKDTAGGGGGAPGGAPGSYGGASSTGGTSMSSTLAGVQILGNLGSVQQFLDRGPEPIQGRRAVDYLNVYQGGVTHRLYVPSIESLTFKRQAVASTLPPYVAADHTRSSATVKLTDGSALEADYVNPGTMFLRGTAPEGRVEIPWEDIETVRLVH